MAITPLPDPIKGKADWREYKAFQLQNGVICLAIRDKESKTTAMACAVNVGAAADPRTLSGLAHFCEHMCFLGSEKYPGENEYKRYLSSHGGRSNASTSMHLTTYKFDVLAEHAEKAVDIFSNFFIAPLFTVSGTGREIQAVDSENSKNLIADGRRRLQILKDNVVNDHYYSKFSTGNSETLQTDDEEKLEWVRGALLAFHAKHYLPEHMTVVIAGPQSLEVLQDWVETRFSKIEKKTDFPSDESKQTPIEKLVSEAAKDLPPYAFHEPTPAFNSPFQTKKDEPWPMLLSTKPVRSMRKLALMFPMESDRKNPDQSPSSSLSHLLGHEGEGSAFAVLQNHGMLNSLSAGPRTSGPDFKLFQVDMELTEKGEKHWKQVVDLVFAYCRLINEKLQTEPNEMQRIWGESSQLDKIFFDQTSPGVAYAYAPNISQRIIAYGTEKCLSAGSKLDECLDTFPLDSTIETARLLNPQNCFLERCSDVAWEEAEKGQGFRKKTEKWYGVEYYSSQIDDTVISSWNGEGSQLESPMSYKELSLPRPNMYIPRTLDLCEELPEEARVPRINKTIDSPNLLIDGESGRLFHRLDDRYALPQSSFNILIRNAATMNTRSDDGWKYDPTTVIMSSMLSGIFSQSMAQETYDAELAGLYWGVSLGASGIRLNCYGFSDRLPDLTLNVIGEFLAGKFLKDIYFDAIKDRVIRGLKTYFTSRRADSNAIYYRGALLASNEGGIEASLALAETIKLQDLKDHHDRILRNNEIFLDCLVTGNVSSTTARDVFGKVNGLISEAKKKQGTEARHAPMSYIPTGDLERRVPPGEDYELHFQSKNPEEQNGAVVFTYQSSIPGFRGPNLSHPLSLKSTSTIRLLCHMLREPLFDELRTKQQLGYVVSSYYENGFSSRQPGDSSVSSPYMVPVDFITINVMSRKVSPPEVSKRIDDFLTTFRDSLEKMPKSEILDHASALSTKMMKPIQKLSTEATNHFASIQRYAPECESQEEIPWSTVHLLAQSIESLDRKDLLEVWDRMIDPSSRSRVVSCVYGNTFPLKKSGPKKPSRMTSLVGRRSPIVINNNFSKVMEHRQNLSAFDNQCTPQRRSFSARVSTRIASSSSSLFSARPSSPMVMGLAGMIGVAGLVGWTMLRNQRIEQSR